MPQYRHGVICKLLCSKQVYRMDSSKSHQIDMLLVDTDRLRAIFEQLIRQVFVIPEPHPVPDVYIRRFLIHLLIERFPHVARSQDCDVTPACGCFFCLQTGSIADNDSDSDTDADIYPAK